MKEREREYGNWRGLIEQFSLSIELCTCNYSVPTQFSTYQTCKKLELVIGSMIISDKIVVWGIWMNPIFYRPGFSYSDHLASSIEIFCLRASTTVLSTSLWIII